jgi:hypothetical protein
MLWPAGVGPCEFPFYVCDCGVLRLHPIELMG